MTWNCVSLSIYVQLLNQLPLSRYLVRFAKHLSCQRHAPVKRILIIVKYMHETLHDRASCPESMRRRILTRETYMRNTWYYWINHNSLYRVLSPFKNWSNTEQKPKKWQKYEFKRPTQIIQIYQDGKILRNNHDGDNRLGHCR